MFTQRSARVVGVLCVIVVASQVNLRAADRPSLEDLLWLAGSWVGSAGGTTMEEVWTEPAGGVMLGLHRDVTAGRPVFFEYLRIEQRESSVVYIASPRGTGATEFTLVSTGAAEVVFENPEHDYPQRIIYRREGELLIVRIEGEVSGETQGQEWQWRISTPARVAGSTPE